jgi:mono/diheme cytochrome c family protein
MKSEPLKVTRCGLLLLAVGLTAASLSGGCRSEPVKPTRSISASGATNSSAALNADEILKYSAAMSVTVVVTNDPVYEKPKTFAAVPLPRLLNLMGFDSRSTNGELVATCSDGYKAVVPLSEALDGTGYLAFSEGAQTNTATFAPLKTPAGVIDLQPLYMVWTTANPAEKKWPYQIQKIEIFASGWTLAAAEPSNALAARRGFDLFRKNCSSCHSVNGAGGRVAVDLNVPMNVTEYWKEPILRKLLVNAPSVRANSKMPAFPHLSNSDVDALVHYLRDMRLRKIINK